jgi:Uma2 family endonuclease
MTYEEFLAWADEDVHAEWKDGEVIVQMPPKNPHQLLSDFLNRIIGLFVAIFDLGLLRAAPFEVRLWEGGPAREPDLLFLAKEHLDRLIPERIIGAPDLIIEIVSDDSVHRDRVDKLDDYETASVREYWVIDNRPRQKRAWFYQLDATGRYHSVPIGADGVYRSVVLPGFWLRVAWLWEEQPNELRALAEVVGVERLAAALQRASSESDT